MKGFPAIFSIVFAPDCRDFYDFFVTCNTKNPPI